MSNGEVSCLFVSFSAKSTRNISDFNQFFYNNLNYWLIRINSTFTSPNFGSLLGLFLCKFYCVWYQKFSMDVIGVVQELNGKARYVRAWVWQGPRNRNFWRIREGQNRPVIVILCYYTSETCVGSQITRELVEVEGFCFGSTDAFFCCRLYYIIKATQDEP